jgi:hypothetical protein
MDSYRWEDAAKMTVLLARPPRPRWKLALLVRLHARGHGEELTEFLRHVLGSGVPELVHVELAFHTGHVETGHKVVKLLRSLGIVDHDEGFSGIVPPRPPHEKRAELACWERVFR